MNTLTAHLSIIVRFADLVPNDINFVPSVLTLKARSCRRYAGL